jgi:hypothetical protein
MEQLRLTVNSSLVIRTVGLGVALTRRVAGQVPGNKKDCKLERRVNRPSFLASHSDVLKGSMGRELLSVQILCIVGSAVRTRQYGDWESPGVRTLVA